MGSNLKQPVALTIPYPYVLSSPGVPRSSAVDWSAVLTLLGIVTLPFDITNAATAETCGAACDVPWKNQYPKSFVLFVFGLKVFCRTPSTYPSPYFFSQHWCRSNLVET